MSKCVSITPSVICIELMQSADSTFEFILSDERRRPVDITGQTVVFTVKDYIGGNTKITKSNGAGEHTDPTNGRTSFTITDDDIDLITEKERWVYEIRRIDTSANEYVHIMGDFLAYPSVRG